MEFDPMFLVIIQGLEKITHIGNDGLPAAVYTDCVSLKRMAAEYGTDIDGEPQDTYLIELSTDASIGEIRVLQSKITALEDTNIHLQETVDALVLASLEPKETEGSETDV